MALLSSQNLDRRTLIKLFGSAGAAATFASLPTLLRAAEGPTLTWARPSETTLYNPHASSLGSAWQVQHLVYESLVALDDDLKVVPSLATEWAWEDTTLVFTLRDGVKFANGRAMTQDDVVGSIKHALAAVGNPWPLILRNFDHIEARGSNQVAMVFKGANSVALDAMTASLVCILPMVELEAGTFSTDTDMFMGTGPFLVESHVANDNWVLTKNPNYWNAGMPKVDRVIVRTIPATPGLVAALRDGSADIATFDANPDAPALLAGIAEVQYVSQKQTAYHFLALNAVAPGSIFLDLKVRQAVALTLDRQQIVDFVYAGNTAPTFGFTQFGASDADLPLAMRDVERAKALIKEAGAEGKTVEMIYAQSDVNANFAQIIKQQLAEIGLTVNLLGLEEGVWLGRVWGSNPSQFDMTVTYYSGFSNPLITAHWWAPELAGFTAGHVAADAEYSADLEAAMFSTGDAQAGAMQKLYVRMNELANKIPLVLRVETVAWRSDKVAMQPSMMQAQEDVMAGIENFEAKA